jgi:hypothetical protein
MLAMLDITTTRTRAAQRRNVFVVVLALLVWLLAYATHVHSADDQDGAPKRPPCSFCLLLPSGAAPAPTLPGIVVPVFHFSEIIGNLTAALGTADIPSFYLSRAPPAL